MLLARDDPKDHKHARELLDQALTTSRDLGMNDHASRTSPSRTH
jgi:hypothetical protein